MANKEISKRAEIKLQQECTYLTYLIQQHKHTNNGRRTTSKLKWSNKNATDLLTSKYKKINISPKSQVSYSDMKKSNTLILEKDNDGLSIPSISKSLNQSSNSNIIEHRKLYLNPHFSKVNRTEDTNKQTIPPSSAMGASIYVNPKVLAKIMKANIQNEVSISACADTKAKISELSQVRPTNSVSKNSTFVPSRIQKDNLEYKEELTYSKTSASQSLIKSKEKQTQNDKKITIPDIVFCNSVDTKKYKPPPVSNSTFIKNIHTTNVLDTNKQIKSPSASIKRLIFCSKTKLIKQNVAVPDINTNNNMTNVGPSTQVIPKSKSPMIKKHTSLPLMSISRTKLIRARPKKSYNKSLQNFSNRSSNISLHTMNLKRKSSEYHIFPRLRRNSSSTSTSVVKAAKAVCSKYKYTRVCTPKPLIGMTQNATTKNSVQDKKSKYKIDRRSLKMPRKQKQVRKYSVQYKLPKQGFNKYCMNKKLFKYKSPYKITKFGFKNKIRNSTLKPTKVLIRNKKLLRIGSSPNLRKGGKIINNEKSSSLVRIGGVLYRTSKLKLTRSVAARRKSNDYKTAETVKNPKSVSKFAVYVRGNKFLMDSSGKTLLRIPQKSTEDTSNIKSNPIRRIDIGGVTFIQKSTNVLIRTNTHNARSVLSQAKQKSIAMLSNKLKKSNQSCIFYHRFGKCHRKESGTCPYIHDSKLIAVCKKFLLGTCQITDCLLSHEVGPEKMPTCKYFLEGCCVRDNCPYLHVKVNAKAVICKDFLRGYCTDGEKCRKRHTYICPDYEKTRSCSKGKYCPYPHTSLVKKKRKEKNITVNIENTKKVPESSVSKRYYESREGTETDIVQESMESDNSAREITNNDVKEESMNDSSDLNSKRLKLLKKIDDMKRCWLNTQYSDNETNTVLNDDNDGPKSKRPKLGILPAYIPLE